MVDLKIQDVVCPRCERDYGQDVLELAHIDKHRHCQICRAELSGKFATDREPKQKEGFAKIGIDTGVNTGIAVWQCGKLQIVDCMTITKAMRYILACHPHTLSKLYVEDARLWVGFSGKTKQSESKRQGAGSVKRDAKIWEDWCKEHDYEVVFVKPMGGGAKKTAEEFKRITGWTERTNQHARDAAMIVYGR